MSRSRTSSSASGGTDVGDDGRLQSVADELAIRNLLARFAQLADGDTDDLTAYLGCLTEDAVWEGAPGPDGVPNVRCGHAHILEGARARRAAGVQGPGTHTRHTITTIQIEVDGDAARGSSYYIFYGDTDHTPVLRSIGAYADEFRRTGSGWKLAHRVIRPG